MQNLGLNMLNGNLRNANLNNQCQKTYYAVNNLKKASSNTQPVFTGKKNICSNRIFSIKEIIESNNEKEAQEKARLRAKWLYEKAKDEDTRHIAGVTYHHSPQKNVDIFAYTHYDVLNEETIEEKISYFNGEPYEYLIQKEKESGMRYYPNSWTSTVKYAKCFTYPENNPQEPKPNIFNRIFGKINS